MDETQTTELLPVTTTRAELPPILLGRATPAVERQVENFYGSVADILERWVARSSEAPKLVYANPQDRVNSLMASADEAEGEGFPTPSSLRDVDGESNLYLVRI